MQYIFHKESGKDQLIIENELYKYIVKVRRKDIGHTVYFRNLSDANLYHYKIHSIDRRKILLQLILHEDKRIVHSHSLHIGWCVVDPKTVEKTLTSLNEMGVDKITFIYCEYSQQSFKPNFDRLEKILINSSQQCGRSSLLKLNSVESLEQFKHEYPESFFIDFSQNRYESFSKMNLQTIVIGPEGGFCEEERKQFNEKNTIGFDTQTVLKSETAVLGICAKILL
ncbi:MAG: 16S rRNA (uracil(1498)-N(3))-methyltransferase [Campylobacterota bacterium]|nr:16S rRNA (uracil(1498)-N(3))-methyltransferase [Campylobacterota bacterium]